MEEKSPWDWPQITIQYGAEKMRFGYPISKANTHTHIQTHAGLIFNTYCLVIDLFHLTSQNTSQQHLQKMRICTTNYVFTIC
jgi:hypothetical protein